MYFVVMSMPFGSFSFSPIRLQCLCGFVARMMKNRFSLTGRYISHLHRRLSIFWLTIRLSLYLKNTFEASGSKGATSIIVLSITSIHFGSMQLNELWFDSKYKTIVWFKATILIRFGFGSFAHCLRQRGETLSVWDRFLQSEQKKARVRCQGGGCSAFD